MVEGIPVGDAAPSVPDLGQEGGAPVAQERVDFQGEDDQIALESNIAEERDGPHGVIVAAPPNDNYAAESIDSYSAPQVRDSPSISHFSQSNDCSLLHMQQLFIFSVIVCLITF